MVLHTCAVLVSNPPFLDNGAERPPVKMEELSRYCLDSLSALAIAQGILACCFRGCVFHRFSPPPHCSLNIAHLH